MWHNYKRDSYCCRRRRRCYCCCCCRCTHELDLYDTTQRTRERKREQEWERVILCLWSCSLPWLKRLDSLKWLHTQQYLHIKLDTDLTHLYISFYFLIFSIFISGDAVPHSCTHTHTHPPKWKRVKWRVASETVYTRHNKYPLNARHKNSTHDKP